MNATKQPTRTAHSEPTQQLDASPATATPLAPSASKRPAATISSRTPKPIPILEVSHFSKSYGGTPVVRDISLAVMPRRIFGFVGPNGAGKTTLIRSIVGAQTFDGGTIRICGLSVREHPVECKSLTAYVPDNPDVYGFLTGSQYLNYLADLFSVPRDLREQRIARYAGLLEIDHRLDELISAYSHGMRQKLVLVGAFLHDPNLLVLDEPFVGLDPQAAFNLRTMMREQTDRGGALFFSSHVLDTVEKLCDEVAIIKDGRLAKCGTTDEVRGDASLEDTFLELARNGGSHE